MRREGVKAEGPAVFTPDADDPRLRGCFPALTDKGQVLLGYRWPGFVTNLPAKPVRVSVIYMGEKPRIAGPFSPDPYRTLPIEEESPGIDRAKVAEVAAEVMAEGAA